MALASLILALPLAGAQAFKIPLTTGQRAQKLVEQGYERIIRGDYTGALSFCEEALKVRNDWAPAYICRSEARLWLRDPLSDRDARQAMRFDPNSGDPHRLLGLWEYEAGRYQAAIQNFNRALDLAKLKPEGVTEVYYYRARAKIKLGDLKAAQSDIDHGLGILRGINGSYGDWSFYSLRAEVRRRREDYEGADADERSVVELITGRLKSHKAEAPELLRRRANSYALLGEYERAAQEYGSMLAMYREGDIKTSLERVLALVMGGKYETAAKELVPILEAEPRRPLIRRMRALIRMAAGDSSGAVADLDTFMSGTAAQVESSQELRQALEDDGGALTQLEGWQASAPPRDPKLWGRRALVHAILLEHDQAMSLSAKSLAATPDDEAAHLAREASGLTAGRCPEAEPSLDRLVQRRPESGFHLWLRGECRCRVEDLDGCVEDLEKATVIEPFARAPAIRLASQYRRWLDRRAGSAVAEELSRGLKHYDRARALGALDSADELGRVQTLVDYAVLLPKSRREETLKEASWACKALAREDPEDEQLAQICLEIRQRLSPGSRRGRPKPPLKTAPKK